MGRPKTDNTEQLVVRVPAELRERLVALAPTLATFPGQNVTMTDAVRAALFLGVEALEAKQTPKARGKR